MRIGLITFPSSIGSWSCRAAQRPGPEDAGAGRTARQAKPTNPRDFKAASGTNPLGTINVEPALVRRHQAGASSSPEFPPRPSRGQRHHLRPSICNLGNKPGRFVPLGEGQRPARGGLTAHRNPRASSTTRRKENASGKRRAMSGDVPFRAAFRQSHPLRSVFSSYEFEGAITRGAGRAPQPVRRRLPTPSTPRSTSSAGVRLYGRKLGDVQNTTRCRRAGTDASFSGVLFSRPRSGASSSTWDLGRYCSIDCQMAIGGAALWVQGIHTPSTFIAGFSSGPRRMLGVQIGIPIPILWYGTKGARQ